MHVKSVEIYYNVNRIPDMPPGDWDFALEFRNAALELIETAMNEAHAGEWEGAEIGSSLETGEPEVNFGFSVNDFDQAEAVILKAVEGTPYANIREIARREFDTADFG